ncbi:MAG: DUF484 family protein [Alphaproteobacteria bacterium]|nr:DUF484 family protein [Alphaproteobacteria bacterium]
MSEVLTKEKAATVTPDDIIAFLKDNPNFINDHPEAAALLLPPKKRPKKGEVADFQSYMIERLKEDKEKVMSTTKELVETSRANMTNQQRVHTAVLRMLEAARFDDFIQAITMDLASLLDVDIAVFLVEADGNNIPHISTSGIRVIPEGTVDKWMGSKPVLLQDNIAGIEPIYGGGATLVKSQILLRIDIASNTPPAILAFGSRDADMFQEGQATDQILFMAGVVERCFRRWLELPA